MKKLQKLAASNCMLLAFFLNSCSEPGKHEDAFSIDQYRGQWVILNYWAEWCSPCIKEIPELNALNNEFAEDIEVLAVNFDRITGEELKTLSDRMSIQFSSIDPDPADILRLSRPASLPTTYIFDREGQLSAKLVGPQTKETLLAKTDINH